MAGMAQDKHNSFIFIVVPWWRIEKGKIKNKN